MADQTNGDSLLRIVLVVLAVLLLSPLLMMVVSMPFVGLLGWTGMGMGFSPLVGVVTSLLSLVVVVGVAYVLYRAVTGSREPTDPALEELRMAYARGELSDEEFEQRRRRLRERD